MLKPEIVLIDNYDSFTYTIGNYLQQLGAKLHILQNDDPRLLNIAQFQPTHVVISPGPGTPDEAGYSNTVIAKHQANYPILGICLGHQCIGAHYGLDIIPAPTIEHGRQSIINHDTQGIFSGINNPFRATRYHSWVVSSPKDKGVLKVTASCDNPLSDKPIVMAITHKSLPIVGIQFHPEAVHTEQGLNLLQNFLKLQSVASRKPALESCV